jgi:hypothetical protein
MNRTILLSALSLLAALGSASVRADDITPEPPFTSTRTRAEVIAELQEFQRSGVNPWADDYDMQAGFTSSRSREQAVNEYLISRDQVSAMNAEDSGSSYIPAPARALAVEPVEDGPVVAGTPEAAQ